MNGQKAAPRAINFDEDEDIPATAAPAKAAAPAATAKPAAEPAPAAREPVTLDQAAEPEPTTAAATQVVEKVVEPVADKPAAAAAKTGTDFEVDTPVKPITVAAPAAALPARSGGSAALANFTQSLAADGFEGVELGFGSLPQVVLNNKGKFVVSTDGNVDIGTEFTVLLTGARRKWIYKNVVPGDSKNKKELEDFCYSYDQQNTTDGEPVANVVQRWADKGWTHEVKEYRDVTGQIVSCPHNARYNRRLVLLSVPPSSINRFNGHLVTMRAYGLDMRTVPTKISVGAEIQGAQTYNPWSFEIPEEVLASVNGE